MSAKISGRIEGLEQLVANLGEMKKAVRNRVLRKGINAATGPLLKLVKGGVPIRTRLLYKAMGRKVKAYRASGVTVGIIGPRVGFATEVDGKKIDPAKYAHLVEYGHAGPHPAPPHPFVRPAWDQGKAAAQATMKEKILVEIEAEARKLPKGKK